MAKYSRFDPRNKKSGKHKHETLNKDIKIRELNSNIKNQAFLTEITYDDDDWRASYIEESVGSNRKW